ncbi:hypothetical protein DL766_007508 [Monosporascus sp. MC13-8B]|nr:hypothetical protein DL766_007508 [Monosporascus sp. MC13-8B]
MGLLTRKKRPTQGEQPPLIDHLGYQLGTTPIVEQRPQLWGLPYDYQHHTAPASALLSRPAGSSSPPQAGNDGSLAGMPPQPHYENQRPCQPIIVNQHYYLGLPPAGMPSNNPYPGVNVCSALSKPKINPTVDLPNGIMPGNADQLPNGDLPGWHSYGAQLANQDATIHTTIWAEFNNVMTLIDGDHLSGHEKDLFTYESGRPSSDNMAQSPQMPGDCPMEDTKDLPKGQSAAVASSLISKGYFSKVDLYANSKLPPNFPPLQLPRGAERDMHVNADWKTGTKAMCIKSVSMDHMDTIVFAVRGTATFMDWAVNLNTEPTSPAGFLDDDGNLCHAGFLAVARRMIGPVASRLRQLLEENPRRASYSLLITGHSAGGAIASLLYTHMLATSPAASSELNALTGRFRRLHCITFGTPPVSLLPLQKPNRPEFKKFMFLSFVNEGDPVARADKAYVKSLLELLAAPAPAVESSRKSNKTSSSTSGAPSKHNRPREKSKLSLATKESKTSVKSSRSHSSKKSSKSRPAGPVWKVPPNTLSNAGRIVVLRSGNPDAKVRRAKPLRERLSEGVVAQVITDEQLRDVIWGDPVCHVMKFYAARLEVLAIGAVTAQGQ